MLKINRRMIEPYGTPNHELKVESSFTFCVRLERYSCKSLRLVMPHYIGMQFHQNNFMGLTVKCFGEAHKDCTNYSTDIKETMPFFRCAKFNNTCWVHCLKQHQIKYKIIYFQKRCFAVVKSVSARPLIMKELNWWTYNFFFKWWSFIKIGIISAIFSSDRNYSFKMVFFVVSVLVCSGVFLKKNWHLQFCWWQHHVQQHEISKRCYRESLIWTEESIKMD